MILAAALYAMGRGAPPPELLLGFQMRGFSGALPEAGGLRDQQAGEMSRITSALNVYDAWASYRRAQETRTLSRWTKDNAGYWKIVGQMLTEFEELH